MTKHRDIAVPASAPASISALISFEVGGARFCYYCYYFGSFSGRYA